MTLSRRSALELLGAISATPLLGRFDTSRADAQTAPPKTGAADSGHDAGINSYNVIWESQSRNALESMPCGGGDIGLNVWVEDNDVLFYMSRSGAFDENNGYLKLGRIRLKISPSPFTPTSRFRQELKLEEGCVEITSESRENQLVVVIWVDVHAPVIHVEIESHKTVSAEIFYESWRTEDREYLAAEANNHRSYIGAPQKAVLRKDLISFESDAILAFHRNINGNSDFDMCVHQQGLDQVKDQMWNPLRNLTFGLLMRGDGFVPGGTATGKYASTPFTAWRLKSRTPAKQHAMRIYLHIAHPDDLQIWKKDLQQIVAKDDISGITAKTATRAWWKQFWARSYVNIFPGSPKPDLLPWRIGRNYQVFRYQLGTNAYGTYPTKFNGGQFTTDPEFVDPHLTFNPDFRLWGGGSFTAQNQRLVYWPMLKSGDFDMMESQFAFYQNTLKNVELRTQVYWGHRGASFTEQMESFGLPVGMEYGWRRPAGLDPGIEDSAYVDRLWETALEFCLMILDVERFTETDISRHLNLIESCLTFFDEHFQQSLRVTQGRSLDEVGHLVFFPGTACETYKNTLNSVVTISGLRTVTRRLLQLPRHYLTDEKRTYFEALLGRIPPLPTRQMRGRTTLSPSQLFDHIQNVELPQLYPVFPYEEFGIGRPDLQIAVDTWHFGVENANQKNYVSWHQDAIFCARMGLTDEAKAITIKKMDDSGRRFPTFWGPGHDWVPDHNWGGSGMIGLQDMLLQAVDDKIYVFPAWPRNWDVEFRLHAPMKVVVEGKLRAGRIERLVTEPGTRINQLILPDWARKN